MPEEGYIQGPTIKEWTNFTMKYFQSSPNAFLIENDHYQFMSDTMRVKVVKENILPKFQDKFDTMWNDPEFDFRGDFKLITMICASIQYESFNDKTLPLLQTGVLCKSILLIQEGTVEMYYKKNINPLLIYEDGSYIGDISVICGTRNPYQFILSSDNKDNNKTKIYRMSK